MNNKKKFQKSSLKIISNYDKQFALKKCKKVFKFSIFDYVLYYLYPCNKKKKTLNNTISKIENYLDILNLIQKL